MTVMTTKSGEAWEPDKAQIDKWVTAYPAVDCQSELLAAACWLDANQSKRKTLKGMNRFCNSWLKRAQDNDGKSPFAKVKPDSKPTRTMSSDEMFNTDWANGLAGR